MTITYYNVSHICSTDDGYIKRLSEWSNLIEAAEIHNLDELTRLVSIARVDDIQRALSTLKLAYKTYQDYQSYDGECAIHINLPNNELIVGEMTPEKITAIRTTLLSNLNPTKDYRQLDLSKDDKRIIENSLLARIAACQNIQDVIALYTTIDTSSIVAHQRHSIYDSVRQTLFGASYTTLKKNVIESLQKRAIEILKSETVDTASIETLQKTVFARIHLQRGVSNACDTQFQTYTEKGKKETTDTRSTMSPFSIETVIYS